MQDWLQLIKTHTLLPSRNYIFGYHPHGIFCFGAFCNFGTEATGFSKKFPGICPHLATLAGNFRLPLLRDYLMSGGICPVNRNSMDYLLSRNGTGNAVVIVVGGAAESLECIPGKHSVTLKNRKGFVKLALQQGHLAYKLIAVLSPSGCLPEIREVGEPITVPKIESPSQDEVDLYHDMYVQSLLKLFDRYKVKFGLLETDTLALH
ncbi:UNVERIFIED_CONTAM: hypothetical protein FKN15_017056 [Acipenser sinensis]